MTPLIKNRRLTDTIHLGDTLGMPMMAGVINPKYRTSSSTDNVRFATDTSGPESRAVPITPSKATEEYRQTAEFSRPEEQRTNAFTGMSTRSNRKRGRDVEETSIIDANLIDTWVEGSSNWMAELDHLIIHTRCNSHDRRH